MLMNGLASQNSGRAGALYAFTSFTFTNCGITGRYGPTLAQMQSAYSATSWTQNTAFFNIGAYQGYQKWTVPKDGTYRFDISGARGGGVTEYGTSNVGLGARIQADVQLTKGEFIIICVGQVGVSASIAGGGGGGTFVVRNSGNVPLLIAGAGSGRLQYFYPGINASIETSGTPPGNAQDVNGHSGGGGFLSDGESNIEGITSGGGGFNNGLVGGHGYQPYIGPLQGGHGGFGGGGGGSYWVSSSYAGSGGGGGYSGGCNGTNGYGGYAGYFANGGGGSYVIGSATNVTKTAGYNNSDGYVIVTLL